MQKVTSVGCKRIQRILSFGCNYPFAVAKIISIPRLPDAGLKPPACVEWMKECSPAFGDNNFGYR